MRVRVWRIAGLFFVVLLVIGCGTSGPLTASPASTSSVTGNPGPTASVTATAAASPGPVASLNIVTGSNAVTYGAVWVALANDLFKKNGVEVRAVSYSAFATSAQQLVAGQIDLMTNNPAQAVQIATQGKQTSIISAVANYSGRGFAFMGRPGVTSMAQLQSMGTDCKVGSLPAGTPFYGWVKAVMSLYNLRCTIISISPSPNIATTIASGGVDAGGVLVVDGATYQQSGKGNVIIDPTKMSGADAARLVPVPYPLVAWFGLKENLQAKRESVVRFVRALRQATALMLKASPDQLAQWSLNSIPGDPFALTPSAALARTWELQMDQFPTDGGFISQAVWETSLNGMGKDWQVANFDSKSPAAQYGAIVDMSYFNAAGTQ